MNILNLEFFDKFGENYNFQYNSTLGYWEGKEWLSATSVSLFDSINLFMLESNAELPPDIDIENPRTKASYVDDLTYTFPKLNPNDYIYFKWVELDYENEFFMYDVVRESGTNNQFIQKTNRSQYNFSDYSNLSSAYVPEMNNIIANTSGSNVTITFDYITPEWGIEYSLWSNSLFAGAPDEVNFIYENQLTFNSLDDGEYTLEFKAVAFNNTAIYSIYRLSFEITGGESTTHGFLLIANSAPLDLSIPLQVNIAFNPSEEKGYTRILEGFYVSGSTTTKFLTLEFYGEGEEEDERLKVWGQNFGIKFNKEDALILKDYDIKEGLPDYKQLNKIRKELLVSKDQIFPYVGTYKALANFINIMGYKDVLRAKEYWKNINPNSEYYNKMGLVDITDFLDDGVIDDINFLDFNNQIKFNNQFKKTSMLALVYEFTRTTGEYDDDGIPEIEKTTDFSVDEIFFKLNKLSKKLKREILPLNIKIKDIIGEFIFFQKYNLRYWTDRTDIEELEISKHLDLRIYTPDLKTRFLSILDVKSLFAKKENDFFPYKSFTDFVIDPFDNTKLYNQDNILSLIEDIQDFYNAHNLIGFTELGKRPDWESYDEPNNKIGCPIVLEAYLPDYTLEDLDGVTIENMGQNIIKVGEVKYANYYEVAWKIRKTGSNPYYFEYRGPVSLVHKLPHILPSVGDYLVECRLYDVFGGVSIKFKTITVEPFKPVLLGVTRLPDKFEYSIGNLHNIMIKDLDGSYIFNPRTIVLDNTSDVQTIDVDKKLLDWSTYSNRYGFNINMLEVEIEREDGVFEVYSASSHPYKRYWGTGEGTFSPKVSDYEGATIGDLFHSKLYDLSYQSDFQNGFNIDYSTIVVGAAIKIGNYDSLLITSFSTDEELLAQLNVIGIPGISDYTWSIVETETVTYLHAQAKFHSKQLHNVYEVIL